MYIPAYFKIKDFTTIVDFLNENSFGLLISTKDGKQYATNTPFLVEVVDAIANNMKLYAHIALHNQQVQSLANGANVLCVFQGPHCYISPSWYSAPNVPTWNYKTIQITGTIKTLKEEEVKKVMGALVHKYESQMEKPVTITDIPYAILNEDLKHIYVFEIELKNIEAAFKLSQNKEEKDYLNIINELKRKGDYNSITIASEMEKELNERKNVTSI